MKAMFEVLEEVDKESDENTQISMLRKLANGRFEEFIKYAFNKNLKMALPEGPAPFKRWDECDSHAYLWPEIRRLYIFYPGKSNLTQAKREEQWISLLESVHPKDADLLQNVKDQIWPYENIPAELINKAFPQLLEA
jgi:hypothetical protein